MKNSGEIMISGHLVDVHNREVYPAEIVIIEGKIKHIIRTEDAPARVILPGLTDSHIHIESSMVTPGAFSMAAVKQGTVAVVSDPHEIANVLGVGGVRFMIEDSKKVPLKFYFGAPSCVPATDFETTGASISPEEVEELLELPEIKYLSEMMNFPGVIYENSDVLRKLGSARRLGKPVDGHAPGLTGEILRKYIAAGISTDHECSTIGEAKEKLALGMKILIREGSAARNMEALKDLIRTNPEDVMLCSDDLHPEMLEVRHINKLISQLVLGGYDIYDVIRAATVNPSNHYNLETGLLRQGDPADIIVADSLESMDILETWIGGVKVFDRGEVLFSYKPGVPVNKFNCSEISAGSIVIRRKPGKIRVITALEGELLTGQFLREPDITDPVEPDIPGDILKIVVKDRYNDSAPSVGFIKGFNLKNGAFASSVAHDSHNIICVGTSDEDIVSAINQVIRLKGGLAVSSGGKIHSLQLNIGGIMSAKSVKQVAAVYQELTKLVRENGCEMNAPFMTLSFMALLVIPDLKIGDRGLFDVTNFKPVPLFV